MTPGRMRLPRLRRATRSKRRPQMKIPRVVLVGVVLVVYVAVRIGTKAAVDVKNQDTWAAMFSTEMDAYLDLRNAPQAAETPYVRGKLVTVDVDKRAVDYWTQPTLSDALRADHPAEAGTAALIAWDWVSVGAYVDEATGRETGTGYRSTADVTLVDLTTRQVIERRRFEGEEPAGGQTREGDYRGERPMFKVVRYLEALPRR